MKRATVFAALVVVGLPLGGASCYNAVVGTDAQAAKTVAIEAVRVACDDFQQSVRNAASRKWLGVLNADRIATIDGVIEKVQPLCPGTEGGQMPPGTPTDATVATVKNGTAQINAAIVVN